MYDDDFFRSTLLSFCQQVATGRHREARALLQAGRGEAGKDALEMLEALEKLLATLADREGQLAEAVAELSALRMAQDQRARALEWENRDLRKDLTQRVRHAASLTRNADMQNLFRQIERIANVPVSVLITGETGVGKGLVAQYIHYSSSRAKYPLVSLNCAAIPADLLESELFGIEKGVASGVGARVGHLEYASGGTLFLDEIGDMPLESQAKILKALESGSITRVGGRDPVPIDSRLITATHHDLEEACAQGSFRQDLLFRIKVIRLHIPPLRERREDIPLLARHFLESAVVRYGLKAMRFAPETLRLLEDYSWPGNVRELEHEVERCALLAATGLIAPLDLSPQLFRPARQGAPGKAPELPFPVLSWLDADADLDAKLHRHPDLLAGIFRRITAYTAQSARLGVNAPALRPAPRAKTRETPPATPAAEPPSLRAAETDLVLKTLESCGQNKSRAARQLGITREGLRKKLKRLGLA